MTHTFGTVKEYTGQRLDGLGLHFYSAGTVCGPGEVRFI